LLQRRGSQVPPCIRQPSIKREQIESLSELSFVERKENVVLLGTPGVGKWQ